MSTKSNDYVIAAPARRLLACVMDVVLFLLCFFILTTASYMLNRTYGIAPFLLLGISLNVSIVTFLAVQLCFWEKGTSWGKYKMKLTVVHKETGAKLSVGHMFLRETIGKWISGLILALGYIWILMDQNNQGWHDKLCSCVVVTRDIMML